MKYRTQQNVKLVVLILSIIALVSTCAWMESSNATTHEQLKTDAAVLAGVQPKIQLERVGQLAIGKGIYLMTDLESGCQYFITLDGGHIVPRMMSNGDKQVCDAVAIDVE